VFVSSEIVDIKTLKVFDRVPTYYSVGHNDFRAILKPFGKYMVAYNKITKIDIYQVRVNSIGSIVRYLGIKYENYC
jgi:hypothetical protein